MKHWAEIAVEIFVLHLRKSLFFPLREMKHWNRLLEDAVDSHHGKSLRTCLDRSLEGEQSN